MDKEIKFSFWNYAPFGIRSNKDMVKDCLEAGINLPMSFVYDYKKDKKEDMISLLDECQKNGLKLIISDTRTTFRNLSNMSLDQFRKLVKAAYDDFGHHQAAFGFFVGDEPSPDESDLFINAMKIVKEEMPGLTPFGNLLPYFDAACDNHNYEYYEKILEKILKEAKPPLIGYDQYTQCFDDVANQKRGLESYFLGLNEYRKLCKKYNVPFYMSLLSVGHWHYRVPNEDDIRWQISTAYAYGARGIVWFYFYQNDDDLSYRLSPFTNFGLKKTPMFDIIAREQYLFQKKNKDILDKLELLEVYHYGQEYHDVKSFVPDEYFQEIKNGRGREFPFIVSYFKEINNDTKWVSIVNASQQYANLFRVTFKNEHKVDLWLAPGEMKLFNLDEIFKK